MAIPGGSTAPSSAGAPSGGALRGEIKRFIVEHLWLPGADPARLDDAPLVGSGLDLDSIDVPELITGVEKKFGLRFEAPDLVPKVLTSVSSIASHIAAARGSA
jgi:acyl carrier protein